MKKRFLFSGYLYLFLEGLRGRDCLGLVNIHFIFLFSAVFFRIRVSWWRVYDIRVFFFVWIS